MEEQRISRGIQGIEASLNHCFDGKHGFPLAQASPSPQHLKVSSAKIHRSLELLSELYIPETERERSAVQLGPFALFTRTFADRLCIFPLLAAEEMWGLVRNDHQMLTIERIDPWCRSKQAHNYTITALHVIQVLDTSLLPYDRRKP
jgi:hypothetical protein